MIGRVVTVEAPAKVNLWLRVLAREASGYHSLESLFCAIDLTDVLSVEWVEEGVELAVEGGVDTGPVEQNLVMRAARRFLREVGGGGARIRLVKRIPAAAGLGGGSSDAAATLRALNHLAGEPLSDQQLLQMGIELGSDVPFFLCGSPLALGWGRGERLLALDPLPERPLLVMDTGAAMPTAAAFEALAEARGGEYHPRARRLLPRELASWEEIALRSVNDFESVVGEAVPAAAEMLVALEQRGATIARLAGSGACVFGIFPDDAHVELADLVLRDGGSVTWPARTLRALPPIVEGAAESPVPPRPAG